MTGWDGDPFGQATEIGADKLAAVAKEVHLQLPAGSALLAGYYFYWQEWVASLRLQLPRAGLAELVSRSALPQPTPGLRPSQVMHPNHPASRHDNGWHPNRPVQVSGIDRNEVDGVFRELMFDLDRVDLVTAYLIVGDAA